MLETSEIFNLFYRLVELRSRDDIVRALIKCLNYDALGHPRIILSKCLTSANRAIRLYATRYLRQILLKTSHGSKSWIIDLLIGQVYDPNADVVDEAVTILDEACATPEYLHRLIAVFPALDHLGIAGRLLKSHVLAHEAGFQLSIAHDASFIHEMIAIWTSSHSSENASVAYANRMTFLPSFSAKDAGSNESSQNSLTILKRYSERHFLGDLAQTEGGAALLQDAVSLIYDRLCPAFDSNILVDPFLQADLWTIVSLFCKHKIRDM